MINGICHKPYILELLKLLVELLGSTSGHASPLKLLHCRQAELGHEREGKRGLIQLEQNRGKEMLSNKS